LTEIDCPSDCIYLASARDHPPAAAVRRQQHDLTLFVQALRDFNRRQSQLFLAINTVIARYEPPELQPIVDDDVFGAAAALAATYETASRGVIYEHRPSTIAAGRGIERHLAGYEQQLARAQRRRIRTDRLRRERAGNRLLQAALVTLPERRQRVQTRMRLTPPLIIALTV
jgi:hypothetical protein